MRFCPRSQHHLQCGDHADPLRTWRTSACGVEEAPRDAEAGQQIRPDDQSRLLNDLEGQFGQSQRFAGTIRVIVVENHNRRLPFPEDLFRGPFDQRWGWWGNEWCGPMWMGYDFGTTGGGRGPLLNVVGVGSDLQSVCLIRASFGTMDLADVWKTLLR